ncbi:binding-protein-dependent transport systems inner membrane component [Sulfobacillus acidophilus TPY]|uniref:ABC-type transporter, integral membrane subunit n=1 Tax=Sulfobacillus acidophilus (strain ATCC 700253 / DSM 10332 / NAL) TaxID=679936 RepID=G8U1I4_SULAD|nr:binding-protein-dependent transport systems inner membrane component [Sulfobacillus acidophilus TPY]AEW06589.1 ABC-type transporter, integral membrane subunit [Sulfobacillus acidophilus DSM 10332]MCY0863573.1 ABC transporter permease [Sulfobacillus sp.]
MAKYVLYRIIQAIPALIGITIIGFFLVHIVPGGPAQAILGARATPAKIAEVNRIYGLNKPIIVQYVIWLGQLLHGNLGQSYFYNQSVVSLIAINLPRTLAIVGIGVVVAHLMSILLGSLQAYYRNTVFDYVATAISYFFYSMPTFWLAIILILVFSIDLNWFPSGGLSNPLNPNPGFGSWLAHSTLPIVTIILVTVAGWGRYMRTAMEETLVQDYIRTARAKGIKETVVVLKHGLRNSVLPLITLLGFSIPNLFAGALYVEVVFNYPGMGLLFWDAALQRDYPVIMGIVVITGVLTIVGNLLADLLYGLVDPRIKYT